MPLDLGAEHALLLQGPPGPFFRRLTGELTGAGVRVDKINFHGGDELYYPAHGPALGSDRAVSYRGTSDEWPDFCRRFLAEQGIDAVVLFGDCRPIHKAAIREARALGVAVWVFEEGYLRPDYVTLERDGVNGYSRMPRDAGFYLEQAAELPEPPAPAPTGQSFYRHAYYVSRYALALERGKERFPGYRHHRSFDPRAQAVGWLRGGLAKPWHAQRDRALLPRLSGPWASRYFLVPLQVHADYQILEHSNFDSVDEMLDRVVRSFAAHAPRDTILVFKHHPMDRGNRDYGRALAALARELDLEQRLVSVHDLHLPTLLKHARGVVTVNSTVGLSAIHHGVPLLVLGDAIYDIPGLTSRLPLERFWHEQTAPDRALYQAFTRYLRWTNQHNGNFYRPLSSHGAGIRWIPALPGERARRDAAGAR
jgi:capsule polysaccharide modification protein KpsS